MALGSLQSDAVAQPFDPADGSLDGSGAIALVEVVGAQLVVCRAVTQQVVEGDLEASNIVTLTYGNEY